MSSPVTDGEQWSDETETEVSPQGLGYAPLDYQVLEGGEPEEEDVEHGNGAGEIADEDEDEDGDTASSQQPDVASAMLRAMEADYRACVESEARIGATSASNGPLTPTEASREEHVEHVGPELEANGSVISTLEQEQGESGGGGEGGGAGGGGLATAAAEAGAAEAEAPPPPPRPISPLGQDHAERVMRAMQGFSLAPPARFEADWGSPDALANLGATATTAATNSSNTNANVGAEDGGGEVLRRNGPNTDRDQ